MAVTETAPYREQCIYTPLPATVMAQEMSLGEYLELRGWRTYPEDDVNSEGYLVERKDWGPPNHPKFDGFILWIPETQFKMTFDRVPANTN